MELPAKTIISGAANLLSTISAVSAAKNCVWASGDVEIHGHHAIVSAPCANRSAADIRSFVAVFWSLFASLLIHYCVLSPGKLCD